MDSVRNGRQEYENKMSRSLTATGHLLLSYFRIDSMRRRKSFRAQTVGTG